MNPYEGVSDPAEVLKIMLAPSKHDPLVRLLPHPKSAEELTAVQHGKDALDFLAQTLRAPPGQVPRLITVST